MPKPRPGETHDDFMGRCMGDAEAIRDFPTRAQRAAFCNSMSRQATSQQVLSMAAVQSSAAARTDSMMGKEFLVVPAVLVQDQVLRNNLGACFLPPEEISDAWAAQWNNVPVVVHAHPTVRGVPVSARTPEILKAYGVGYVFGVHVSRNGSVKLKGEVWLDLARASEVEELAVILERIRQGKTVELSTGFSATVEDTAGEHDGKTYEKVIHPQDADHLAIFAEATGACSLADGCGLGVNAEVPAETVGGEPPLPVNLAEGDHEEGQRMEPAADNQEKVLHIVDRLLALVGLSSPAKAAAPTAAAPARIVVEMVECLDAGGAAANAAVTHPLLKRLVALGLTPCQARVATGWARAENLDYPESDEELRAKLYAALQKQYGGGPEKGVWVEAVFQADAEVVFCVVQDKAVGGRTEQYFRAAFTLQDAGQVTFAEPIEVKRRVVYEKAVANSEPEVEVPKMTEQEKKDADAAAAAAAPAVAPVAAVQAAAPAAPATPAPAVTPSADVLALQQKLDAQALEIAALKGIVAPAVAEQERARTALIAELAANEAVPFDEAELKAKPLAELEKLQLMAKPGSFAGRGGPRIATQAADEGSLYAEPVPYFKKTDEKEGK